MHYHLEDVSSHFQIEGEYLRGEPYGSGHINDTFAVAYRCNGRETHYIHQRINHHVFRQPEQLMENVQRVTLHIQKKIDNDVELSRFQKSLTLVPTREGKVIFTDPEGNYWRTYEFIEGAQTYDSVQSARQAYEASRAFGQFQYLVSDLAQPRLHETIPNFHNGRKRFQDLLDAVEKNPLGREQSALPEIEFALHHEDIVHVFPPLVESGAIPERITHNDCKFNNVMLDDGTGKAVCVVDLDTVMPGLVHYDFGDMIRTTTSPTAEDERNLSRIHMHMDMFQALLEGYLDSAGAFLTEAEKEYLPFAGKYITFLIGLRFLTDYLLGDVYFKVHREGHNLDRCRTQFQLIRSMEKQKDAMLQVRDALLARP